jgi:hypothetical protein
MASSGSSNVAGRRCVLCCLPQTVAYEVPRGLVVLWGSKSDSGRCDSARLSVRTKAAVALRQTLQVRHSGLPWLHAAPNNPTIEPLAASIQAFCQHQEQKHLPVRSW